MKKMNRVMALLLAVVVCVMSLGVSAKEVQGASDPWLMLNILLQGPLDHTVNVEIGIYYRDTRVPVNFRSDALSGFTSFQGALRLEPDFRVSDLPNLRIVFLSGIASGVSLPLQDFYEGRGGLSIRPTISELVTTSTTPNRTLNFVIDNTALNTNGTNATLDAAPFIANGRTMVPIRAIAEAFGSTDVAFNNGVVTFSIDGTPFSMTIGQALMDRGGAYMGTPVIVADRTFVPVRFIVEELGMRVEWDADTRAISITN